MNILLILVPVALALGLAGLAAFLWSLESGQYDDMDGAAVRILGDDDVISLPQAPDRKTDRNTARRAAAVPRP